MLVCPGHAAAVCECTVALKKGRGEVKFTSHFLFLQHHSWS